MIRGIRRYRASGFSPMPGSDLFTGCCQRAEGLWPRRFLRPPLPARRFLNTTMR